MKIPLALLSATAVGFVGITTLHSPSGQRTTTSKVSAPTTTAPAGSGPTTTTVPKAPVNGTATGLSENYGYGTMSVQVTVVNSKIVGLKVAALQTLESYSQQLEQQVVPILKAEVLRAQGTAINAISGATYTSEAYAYSIQSALDKLHLK